MTTNGDGDYEVTYYDNPDFVVRGESTDFDMRRARDRNSIAAAARRKWGITDEVMSEVVVALRRALNLAIERNNPREIRGCARTFEALRKAGVWEDVVQADTTDKEVTVNVKYERAEEPE